MYFLSPFYPVALLWNVQREVFLDIRKQVTPWGERVIWEEI
jgi:hypothetical protein